MGKAIRVIVCGGRDFDDREMLFAEMDRLLKERGPFDTIINGGYRGADTLAGNWCLSRLKKLSDVFNVDPKEWSDINAPGAVVKTMPSGRKYNANAGPKRNQRMLVVGKPDLVVAFPGGNGTADMIRRSHRFGVEVIEIANVRPPRQQREAHKIRPRSDRAVPF